MRSARNRDRRRLLRRLLEARQRAGVLLRSSSRSGHEQLRSPGRICHPHGRRRGQHLGLRRDDQLPSTDEHNSKALALPRLQRGRGHRCRCSHAARQGARRKIIVVDPRFTRTARRRTTSTASVPGPHLHLRHAAPHFRQRWGGQEYIAPARVGMDKPRTKRRSGRRRQ